MSLLSWNPPGTRVTPARELKPANKAVVAHRFGRLVIGCTWPWVARFARLIAIGLAVWVAVLAFVVVAFTALSIPFFITAPVAVVVPAASVVLVIRRVSSGRLLGGPADDALGRSLASVLGWRWPGLSKRSDMTETVDGRVYAPALEAVVIEAHWSWTRVLTFGGRLSGLPVPVVVVERISATLRLHPRILPDSIFSRDLDRRVAASLRCSAHSQRDNGDHTQTVTLRPKAVENYLGFPGQRWVDSLIDNPAAIPIGRTGVADAPTGILLHELDVAPHWLITGKTNGGKSTPMRLRHLAGAHMGVRQIVLNAKPSGEFGWLKRLALASVVDTELGWWAAANWFQAERIRRQDLVTRHGVDTWRDVPSLDHRVFFDIDEAVRAVGGVGSPRYPMHLNQIGYVIADAAGTARSAGGHMTISTQYPLVSNLGGAGGLLRFNMGARIAMGATTREGLKVSFDQPDLVTPDIANHLDGRFPGRCLYTGFNTDHGHLLAKGQVYDVSQVDAEAWAPTEPTHGVIDFDALGQRMNAEFQTHLAGESRQKASAKFDAFVHETDWLAEAEQHEGTRVTL